MKPIIFNTEMVRAILDGRKTAMRRVIKPQPIMYGFAETHFGWHGIKQPYHPGDIMYVQETWQYLYIPDRVYIYEADADGRNKLASAWKGDWKPSTHMPKEAARVFLRVTDIYVERLQDIAETDAIKEGFEQIVCNHPNGLPCTDCLNTGYLEPAMASFYTMWEDDINEADRKFYGLDANPWIWVIEFEQISKEDAK